MMFGLMPIVLRTFLVPPLTDFSSSSFSIASIICLFSVLERMPFWMAISTMPTTKPDVILKLFLSDISSSGYSDIAYFKQCRKFPLGHVP